MLLALLAVAGRWLSWLGHAKWRNQLSAGWIRIGGLVIGRSIPPIYRYIHLFVDRSHRGGYAVCVMQTRLTDQTDRINCRCVIALFLLFTLSCMSLIAPGTASITRVDPWKGPFTRSHPFLRIGIVLFIIVSWNMETHEWMLRLRFLPAKLKQYQILIEVHWY